MTPPGTFERVYAAIKQRLREGFYRPGARLEPSLLADELSASVTPVRDALHRLTGERLVETPRHDGFRAPMMTEPLLRQLYGWHLDLLLLAAAKRMTTTIFDSMSLEDAHSGAPVYERQEALFLALARSTGNPEHAAAVETLGQRLEPVQRLEEIFLDETESETLEIIRAVQKHDRKSLRRSLVRYHRRRERIVPQLVETLLGM